jgi:hypothetical protein
VLDSAGSRWKFETVATFSKLQLLIQKRRYLFEKDAEDLKH